MTQNERYNYNKASGLCRCGGEREFLSASCKPCNEMSLIARNKRRANTLKARVITATGGEHRREKTALLPDYKFHRSNKNWS